MNDKFIAIFGIIVVAVILNSIAQFLIVWNLNKIRRLFKEEFPNKTDLLVLLMSDLIPKGTPQKIEFSKVLRLQKRD